MGSYAQRAAMLGGGFNPLQLRPELWVDRADAVTIFRDAAGSDPTLAAGDVVGCIKDKSGNGRHMVQATGASQPLLTGDGIAMDGTDDNLQVVFALNQPFYRVGVYSSTSSVFGGNFRYFLDGGSGASGIRYNASQFQANAGTLVTLTGLYAAWISSGKNVLVERWDGASSTFAVNGTSITVNPGTTAPNGVTFGAFNTGAGAAVATLHEMLILPSTRSTDEIAALVAYLRRKWGL